MYRFDTRSQLNLILFCALLFSASNTHALNCTSPAASPGGIERFTTGGYKICSESGVWQSIDLTATNSSCTNTNAIDYDRDLGKHKVCESGVSKSFNCASTTSPTGYCTLTSELKIIDPAGATNDTLGAAVSSFGSYLAIGSPGDDSARGSALIFKKVGDSWQYLTKFYGADSVAGNSFGKSLSVHGNTLVVGSSAGAAYVFTVDGSSNWTQQAKLVPSNLQGATGFGQSVSVFQNTIVVTASGAIGRAWIFTRSGTTWSEQQSFTGSTIESGDGFGYSAALNNDSVIVGAPNNNGQQGTAHIFKRVGTVWSEEQVLAGSNSVALDQFGISVAIENDAAVVGSAVRNTVYYFTRSVSTWSEQAKITSADTGTNSFGISVALETPRILIGASGYGSGAGAAYVFEGSGSLWTQQERFTPADITSGDNYGAAVALNGSTSFIGANFDSLNSTSNVGSVYVQPLTGIMQKFSALGNEGTAGDGWSYGGSISIDGNYLVIGAPYDDDPLNAANNEGAAFVFVRDANGVWSFQQKLVAPIRISEFYSSSLAIGNNGSTVAIGASNYSSATGRVYIYTRSGTNWSHVHTITGTTSGENFGSDMAISGDTVAVAAYTANSNSGKVYVYRFNGTNATLEQTFTRPTALADSYFGDGLALQNNTLVVGSPGSGTLTSVPGKVWVYNRSGNVWGPPTELVNPLASTTRDRYGFSIAIDGTTLVVSRASRPPAEANQGVVVWTGSGSSWTVQQTISSSDSGVNDAFGSRVSVFGNRLAVGVGNHNSYLGAVYLYARSAGVWTLTSKVAPSDLVPNSEFGQGVAVSDDGYTIATNLGMSSRQGYAWVIDPSASSASVAKCTYAAGKFAGPTATLKATGASFSSASTVSLSAGQSLLVCLTVNTDALAASNQVTWNGIPLTLDHSVTAGTTDSFIFSLHNPSPATSAITVNLSATNTTAGKAMASLVVDGIDPISPNDAIGGVTNSLTTPTVTTTTSTSRDQEFLFACLGRNEEFADGSYPAGTWQNGLTNGARVGTSSTGSSPGTNVTSSIGYRSLTSHETPTVSKSGLAAQSQSLVVVTYKASLATSGGTAPVCADYGQCSTPGSIDYSTGNGLRWCSKGTWQQIKVNP